MEGGLIVPVVAGLAHVSDLLFTTAIAVYSLALVSYCGEYAFGRSGRVARTSAARPAALVGAGTGVPPAEEATEEAGAGDGPGGGAEPSATAGRFGRAAAALTALGLLLHLGSLAARGVATDRVPWGNMYEFSSAAGAVAVTAFLVVVVRQPQVRYLGGFVMLPVILLMFLAGTVLYAQAGPLVPALRSYWLAIHVSAAATATGIFMVSGVATLLYLVRERWERRAAAGSGPDMLAAGLGWRLPAAEVLDRLAYRTIVFGFPIWTFGVIAGGDLGGGRLGPVLGLGPEGDLGVHRLGDLRGVPARPGDRGLAWGEGRPDQPARLLRDAVQLLHRQHRHLRPALLRRPELTVVSTGPPAPLRPCSKSAATTRPGAGSREPSILSGLVGCPSFSEGWRMGGEREAMALRMPTRRARRRRAAR